MRWEAKEEREKKAAKNDDGKTEIKFAPRAVNPLLANDAALPPPKVAKKMAEPLSIEEKLQQLKKSQEDAAKPVFLTKQQREQQALQRMEEQRKERERAAEEARKMREQMQKDLRADREAERRGHRSEREIQRERERERERERRAAAGEPEPEEPVISEKELAVVKARYLGVGKVKKKVVKVTDKHRFAFDWEASEDTSTDVNPLYSNKHEAQLLFGRGLRAGIDMREQKKKSTYVENLEAVRDKIEKESAHMDDGMDDDQRKEAEEAKTRMMKEAYASRAKFSEDKKMSLPGRHWSEKKLAEMTTRDWRIFREDFQITTRGGKCPNPMRNWAESNLPDEILEAIKVKGERFLFSHFCFFTSLPAGRDPRGHQGQV